MISGKEIQKAIDIKTKPIGALGDLEKLAQKICALQKTTTPTLINPHMLVFAADHGAAVEGISAYPQVVTQQMVRNFVDGGAAINVFTRQHDMKLLVTDAGVNGDISNLAHIRHEKVANGTRNYLYEPAMTKDELKSCFRRARKLIDEIAATGCNVVGFGEMGIGNTSSASIIQHKLTGIPLFDCVGSGTGLMGESLTKKYELLMRACQRSGASSPLNVLQEWGGFEIAMMVAGMFRAFEKKMLIIVDGFISSAAFLVAIAIEQPIIKATIFSHLSNENGHKHLLSFFGEQPLLKLNLCLGEGTGCALAYPLIKSAVAFMNEMATFESAGVNNRE